jgi:hypothetical protein
MENPNPAQQPPTPPDDNESRRHGRRGGGASPIFIGLILILLGSLFFLSEQGFIAHDRWWQYFLIGLGGIFLVDAVMRSGQENNQGFVTGRVIAGFVLIGIGVVFLFGFTAWWPLILIAAGRAIIATGRLRRGR